MHIFSSLKTLCNGLESSPETFSPDAVFDTRLAGMISRRNRSKELTSVTHQATVIYGLKIRNFIHKGLKKLYFENSSKGSHPEAADKLCKMLAFCRIWKIQMNLRPFLCGMLTG